MLNNLKCDCFAYFAEKLSCSATTQKSCDNCKFYKTKETLAKQLDRTDSITFAQAKKIMSDIRSRDIWKK